MLYLVGELKVRTNFSRRTTACETLIRNLEVRHIVLYRYSQTMHTFKLVLTR